MFKPETEFMIHEQDNSQAGTERAYATTAGAMIESLYAAGNDEAQDIIDRLPEHPSFMDKLNAACEWYMGDKKLFQITMKYQ